MRRLIVVAGVIAATTLPASAQPVPPTGGPASRPIVSPYLGMLYGGNPVLGYYGLVQPQMQMMQQQQLQQQQFNQLQQRIVQDGANLSQLEASLLQPFGANYNYLPITGHPVAFNNYRNYFNRLPNGMSGASGYTGGVAGFNTLNRAGLNGSRTGFGGGMTGMGASPLPGSMPWRGVPLRPNTTGAGNAPPGGMPVVPQKPPM